MRHFLRIDGGVGVGPSLGAVVFVETGETLHLNEDDPDEGKVAESVAAASSGWVEVDEAGAAVPKRRTATATPVVIEPDNPIEQQLAALHAEDTVDPTEQNPGGQEPSLAADDETV